LVGGAGSLALTLVAPWAWPWHLLSPEAVLQLLIVHNIFCPNEVAVHLRVFPDGAAGR
jgi:hypothetical protein